MVTQQSVDGHILSLGRLWDNLLWFDSRRRRPPAVTPENPRILYAHLQKVT